MTLSNRKSFNGKLFLWSICLCFVLSRLALQCSFVIKSQLRFKSLPKNRKMSCLTIQNKNILFNLKNILKCFSQKKLYCISSGQSMSDFQTGSHMVQNKEVLMQLLKNMKLGILSQPFLYFQSSGSNQFCNKLINWMDQISDYKIFDLQGGSKYDQQIEENILWFSSNSFQKAQNIIVSQIQKSILKHYLYKDSKFKIEQLNELKQFYLSSEFSDCKNKNQLCLVYDLDQSTDLTPSFIQIKTNEVKVIKIKLEEVKQKNIQLELTSEKKKKKRYKKKKNNELQDKEKQIQNQEQKTSIKEQLTFTLDTFNKIEQKNSRMQMKSQVQIGYQQYQQMEMVLEHPLQMSHKEHLIHQQKADKFRSELFSDDISHISKCETELHQTDITIQKYFENQIENEDMNKSFLLEQNSSNQSNLSIEKQRKQVNAVLQHKKIKKQSCRQKKEKQILSIVGQNLKNIAITQFIDQISIQSNNLYNYKLTAYQNIVFFISTILPTTSITLFGSNAVGLALASSDIDIMMNSLKWNSIQQARQVLFHVGSQIAKMGWVIDYRLILNAKVPVLKLFIDPKVDYFSISPLKYAYQTNLQESIIIKADIIINIDGQKNIGCESTILMKQCVGKYPQLQRIILFFKYVLWYYGYNQNYKGGICSYCIFLMIVSFIQNNISNQQFDTSKVQEDYQGNLIVKILRYYAYDFNQQEDIISLRHILQLKQCLNQQLNKTFQLSPQKRSKVLKIIDPINRQFIQSSFSKFQQIKNLFKLMSTQLQNQQARINSSLVENKHLVEDYISLSINSRNDQIKTKKTMNKIINKIVKSDIKFNMKSIVSIGMKIGIQQNMMAF